MLCALLLQGLAHGAPWQCADSYVEIQAADHRQVVAACEASARAIHFLQTQGFKTAGTIEIHLLSELPATCLDHSFGCYNRADRRISMLALSECLEMKTLGELPLNPVLCNGFIAHEIAHALAADNFTIQHPSLLAHEYIANVTMIATLPRAQRERLLEQWPGKGFESADQISTTYYLLQPIRFGVKVYRHFTQLSNSKQFFKRVLSGKLLATDE